MSDFKLVRRDLFGDLKKIEERDAEITRLKEENKTLLGLVIDRTAQIGWIYACEFGYIPATQSYHRVDWSKSIPKPVRDNWSKWAEDELRKEGIKID